MNITTLTRPLALGALAVIMAAPVVKAQQQLFSWTGTVDQQVQLTISGRRITTSNIGPREVGQRSARVLMSMPRENGYVTLQTREGRGTVDVLQQPNSANGYTTIIRIIDPQGGAGDYRVDGFWQASANGDVYGSRDNGPPYGRARGRGQDRDRGNANGNGNVNGNGNGNGVYQDRGRNNGINANRTVLQWSGDVDDYLAIRLTPSGVNYRTVRGNDPRGIQASFNGIPQGATRLIVNNTQGRGSVVVIQQPTAANGYTATVRVLDPQGGYGHYSFDLTWQ